jgi:integral membrane protein (TIGR01906 family)
MESKSKNRISLLLAIIIILSIPPLIYFGVSLHIISDRGFYLSEFEKNSVYDNFEDKAIPDNVSGRLISYFWSGSDQPPEIGLFTQAEKSHLLDVKNLISGLKNTTFLLIAVLFSLKVISLLFFRKLFLKNLGIFTIISGAASIILGLLLAVLALNFEWAFLNFHHLLFPQGNWMFPMDSTLIRLFPAQTFLDFFTTILLRGLILSLLLTLLGIALLFFRKKYKRKNK